MPLPRKLPFISVVPRSTIHLLTVISGVIDTPLAKSLGSQEQINERLISRTALKRIAQPEEVSKVILFLLSEVSGYITGSVSHPHFSVNPVTSLTTYTDHQCRWRIPVRGVGVINSSLLDRVAGGTTRNHLRVVNAGDRNILASASYTLNVISVITLLCMISVSCAERPANTYLYLQT